MRTRRWHRWAVVGAIGLVALFLALDVVALQVFQARGNVQIARGMAAESASLSVGGFPFLPNYVRGRAPEVEVEVNGASAKGLRVRTFYARFADARFPTRRITALTRSRYATQATVRGSEFFGRLEITEGDLEEFIRRREQQVREVRIRPTGVEIRFDLEDGAVSDPVRYLPRVQERGDEEEPAGRRLELVLLSERDAPSEVREAARRIQTLADLPRIPMDLRVDIQLGNGLFELEGQGAEIEVTVGEGLE